MEGLGNLHAGFVDAEEVVHSQVRKRTACPANMASNCMTRPSDCAPRQNVLYKRLVQQADVTSQSLMTSRWYCASLCDSAAAAACSPAWCHCSCGSVLS